MMQIPTPDTMPDFTGYGLLGAFLAVVFLFLAVGLVAVKWLVAGWREVQNNFNLAQEQWRKWSEAREDKMLEGLGSCRATIADNNILQGGVKQAMTTATGAFNKVHDQLKIMEALQKKS